MPGLFKKCFALLKVCHILQQKEITACLKQPIVLNTGARYGRIEEKSQHRASDCRGGA